MKERKEGGSKEERKRKGRKNGKEGRKEEVNSKLSPQVSALPSQPPFPKALALGCPSCYLKAGKESRKIQEATTFLFLRCPGTVLVVCFCSHRVYF